MDNKMYRGFLTVCLLLVMGMHTTVAQAEDEPFLGEMIWVPYNFAPRGWAFCDGQILPIAQNTALFSLLGTTYGGNGQTTFALPDMRGKLMINAGQGPGLSDYVQGEMGGDASHTLLQVEMPAHTHGFQASTTTASATTPGGSLYGQTATGKQYGNGPTASMSINGVGVSGGGQPHNNMMPYGTLNCIIAIQGIFPARP